MSTACILPHEFTKYLDGCLSNQRMQLIAEHVERCEQCAELLQGYKGDEQDDFVRALRRATEFDDEFEHEDAFVEAIHGFDFEGEEATANDQAFPTIGPYQIQGILGSGGMGKVYLATHRHLNSSAAIKLLPENSFKDPVATARFRREMRAVAMLNHPNVVRALDGGVSEGQYYLAMERVEGRDVAEITKQTKLSIANVCEIARQTAFGLQHAHDRGIVHRDIKPSNLMLAYPDTDSSQPIIKILDMGLAKLTCEIGDDEELTHADAMVGTLGYTAPERFALLNGVEQTDLYSLGATMFRLLANESPRKQLNDRSEFQLDNIESKLPKETPRQIVQILKRLLSIDSKNRYLSAKDLAEDLEEFCSRADLMRVLDELDEGKTETKAWRRSFGAIVKYSVFSVFLAAVLFAANYALNWKRNSQSTHPTEASTTRGLIVHLDFEDENVINLVGSNALAPSLNGISIVSSPNRGCVAQFRGDQSVIELPGLLGQPKVLTLAAWVRLDESSRIGSEIVSVGDSVVLRADGKKENWTNGISLSISTGDGWDYHDSKVNIAGSGWRHVAAVIGLSESRLYVDGNEVLRFPMNQPVTYDRGMRTAIGDHVFGAEGHAFNGAMDEIRIYDRQLNATEIQQLFGKS